MTIFEYPLWAVKNASFPEISSFSNKFEIFSRSVSANLMLAESWFLQNKEKFECCLGTKYSKRWNRNVWILDVLIIVRLSNASVLGQPLKLKWSSLVNHLKNEWFHLSVLGCLLYSGMPKSGKSSDFRQKNMSKIQGWTPRSLCTGPSGLTGCSVCLSDSCTKSRRL